MEMSRGQAVADWLAGSWRQTPPPPPSSALADVAPLLLETGSGALGWWRARHCAARNLPSARALRQAYRHQALQALNQEKQLQEIFGRMRSAGVEPILVKGWSLARHYADPGLRPWGDIDLCVRPDQLPIAMDVLTNAGDACGPVDLHAGVADLDGRDWDRVWSRSRIYHSEPAAQARDATNSLACAAGSQLQVRVLGAEDQLRHACLHLLRHEAWRPLWLCDVGAALEALPADFDWGYCLSGQRRLSEWVLCVLGLACRLLDAHIADPLTARRVERTPRWLVDAVLKLWSAGGQSHDGRRTMASCPRTLAGLCQSVWQRWPNPIRATFHLGVGPFHPWPTLAVQAGYYLKRGVQFLRRKSWWRRPIADPTLTINIHPR